MSKIKKLFGILKKEAKTRLKDYNELQRLRNEAYKDQAKKSIKELGRAQAKARYGPQKSKPKGKGKKKGKNLIKDLNDAEKDLMKNFGNL